MAIEPIEHLSHWWRRAVIVTMALGFGVLGLLMVKTYINAPPVPDRIVDSGGQAVFSGDDIRGGQQVFLKYGLMNNGSIWGHGGYLGPDFSASHLRAWALVVADERAQARFGKSYDTLPPADRTAVDGEVALHLRTNRYDPATSTLTLPSAGVAAFAQQQRRWASYFEHPERNGGLAPGLITDKDELRQLTAFFAWAAWASVAERPGTGRSYWPAAGFVDIEIRCLTELESWNAEKEVQPRVQA